MEELQDWGMQIPHVGRAGEEEKEVEESEQNKKPEMIVCPHCNNEFNI